MSSSNEAMQPPALTGASAGPSTGRGARVGAAVTTGVFALLMTFSGVLYLIAPPPVVATLQLLGYPDYFRILLGVAKLLGAAALVVPLPHAPTLREWAYAGFVFDLIAAVTSHLASGDNAAHALPAAFALGLLLTSYFLRRRMAGSQRGE
jgi:hypothetical protein